MTDAGAGHEESTATARARGIAGGAPASGGLAGIEWPKRAADTVQMVVDTIHDKAIRPAALVTRVAVFGIIVTALATLLTVMLAIAAVRLLDVYLFHDHVWASYCLVGGLFVLAGLGTYSLRHVRPRASAGR